jgi:hypothetical protein
MGVPSWISDSLEYRGRLIRGFFDADGSIYRLNHFNAVQMSFMNRSMPLLYGARQVLLDLGYHPSLISNHPVYLTRRGDVARCIEEIGFGNARHHFHAKAFAILRGRP